jgi:hypothetical protein
MRYIVTLDVILKEGTPPDELIAELVEEAEKYHLFTTEGERIEVLDIKDYCE